ncbi:hypothetical protein F2Q68_00004301 [Brassica cretica]|uniref:Cytochrome P450 n=1 Tax=Brassica cretica TaxID=69181 RepID=A0A8S9JFG7_BRACR|nr:hypothetical protein F2Q68_00004301 [Brassica cretica]
MLKEKEEVEGVKNTEGDSNNNSITWEKGGEEAIGRDEVVIMAYLTLTHYQFKVKRNPGHGRYNILKTNFFNFPKGSKPFTDLLGDLLRQGIFNVDGHSWSSQRKLASHEFSTRSLRSFAFEVLREEVETRIVPVLSTAADVGTTVDLQDVFKRFAFDVVCKVSLGWDPNCLDLTRPVKPLAEAFDTAAEISARRATEPLYAVWKAKRVLNVGSERRLREAIRTVHELVSEIVRAKRKSLEIGTGQEAKQDLLSRFLAAGHDSEVVRDMVIRFEELKEMSYMKACLCEAMRLYPPVSWDSKHAANDDVLPTRVKKGDKVTYFPYGMGRMENLWGNDCEEFKPNRWFHSEPGITEPILKPVSPFKFPVFQAGPRVCIGKEMAFMQMKFVVGSVLSRFEIIPVSKQKPVFVPLLTAHMAGGLKVKIKRREVK